MSAWVGRISRQGRGRDCSASSSNPMMEGPPGADSEEKHEPVSDIDTVLVDSLKALDPERPIREADISIRQRAFSRAGAQLIHGSLGRTGGTKRTIFVAAAAAAQAAPALA